MSENTSSTNSKKTGQRLLKISGIAVLGLFLLFLGVQYLEYRTQAEAVVSSQSETKTVEFVDGSSVILAPNSIIKYSNYFNEKGRFVELTKGEAKFSVVEEKGKFRVKTDRELITVLGTTFEVKFDESQTEISVEEGKVNLLQNATEKGQTDLKSLNLTAGESAISAQDTLYKISE